MKLAFWLIFLSAASLEAGVARRCVPKKEFLWETQVCVCNSTYCDEIEELGQPVKGQYVEYTSSLDGLRLERESGFLKPAAESSGANDTWPIFVDILKPTVLHVNRSITYQTVYGFGAAFTDSSGFNLNKLKKGTRRNVMKAYFGKDGIELNMGRVPIGGSDFSTRAYAYNMLPEGDKKLKNFSLEMEDFAYKIPLIRKAMQLAKKKLLLVASTWSPPTWMKTNPTYTGPTLLKLEYYQTYADYHIKFLQEYEKRKIKFWALTTGNEPMVGLVPYAINSMGWIPQQQAHWIVKHFGPTIRKSIYKDLKILLGDDIKLITPAWTKTMTTSNPKVLDFVDAISSHWYSDWLAPSSILDEMHDLYPDKFLISTESTVGVMTGDPMNLLTMTLITAWSRTEIYVQKMIEYFNHRGTGWMDWNLVTDAATGGPSWSGMSCPSPIMARSESRGEEVVKHPVFYALGHFSKFVPRGSVRVDVRVEGLVGVESVAFLRPDGGVVVVLVNTLLFDIHLMIKEANKGFLKITLPRKSFKTVVYW